MKKIQKAALICLAASLLLSAAGCGQEASSQAQSEPVSEANAGSDEASSEEITSEAESSAKTESEEVSKTESEEVSEETNMKVPIPEDATILDNLTNDNAGKKMGDSDGPAYAVYSKVGYNKATMDIAVSDIRINTVRADGRFVNAYMMLCCDVYDGAWWTNCFDTGFCWSGKQGGWHLFYNIYEAQEEGAATWYESDIILNSKHNYRLELDTSGEDTVASVRIIDLDDGEKTVDSVTFGVARMKADGSNTAMIQDLALDFPQNVKKDTQGNPSEDWEQITLYNTDEGLYLQNVKVTNATLYKDGEGMPWTAEQTANRSTWPDKNITAIDYRCVAVIGASYDNAYRLDLDMNRPD